MQHRRLIRAGTENPTLARTLRHQLACAQAEFDTLTGAPLTDSDQCREHVRSHCNQLAGAQAELDTFASESREDQGDGTPFLPFST